MLIPNLMALEIGPALLVGGIGLIIGAGICFLVMFVLSKSKKDAALRDAKQIVRDAKIQAERITKNAEIDAKQAAFEARQQAENDIRSRKGEIQAIEQKLSLREQAIDQRDAALIQKENALEAKSESLDTRLAQVKKKSEELDEKIDQIIVELEKVSGMSTKDAHDEIMARVESKMSMEIATYIHNAEDEAKETAEAKARDLLSLACAKYAQDVTTERTVSVVALPSDELKGRIIGREGRNIQALEKSLGVDLVVDDTPEVITVSCFDPIRREIARRTLEYLIKDGRIQPGRIEEVSAKCKKEVEESCQKYGEDAIFKLGLPRINRELVGYLGRLHFRTSYGQNVLDHSMEVAYLCGIMAAELGLDQQLAKRAGLLHDIGKALDFEVEGNALACSTTSVKPLTSKSKAATSNSVSALLRSMANLTSSSIPSKATTVMRKRNTLSLTSSRPPIPYPPLAQALEAKPLRPTSRESSSLRPSPNPLTVLPRPSRCSLAARSASWSLLKESPIPKRSSSPRRCAIRSRMR